MADFIDYWDDAEEKQKRRQCTAAEQAELDAIRAEALPAAPPEQEV